MDAKPTSGSDNAAGKPGSQPKNGAREPLGATLRVSGVVDPALARDTTGTAARPGNSDATGNATEPATGEPAAEPERRGRGRPPGSTNKPKAAGGVKAETDKPLNINGVEKILFSIHTVLAAIADTSEIAIDEKEAKELAAAIAGVTNEYIIVMSPKTAAWMELGRVCGVIYGPRAVNLWLEARAKQKAPIPLRPRPQADTPPEPQRGFDPAKITLN
jgi:hypothetical protein